MVRSRRHTPCRDTTVASTLLVSRCTARLCVLCVGSAPLTVTEHRGQVLGRTNLERLRSPPDSSFVSAFGPSVTSTLPFFHRRGMAFRAARAPSGSLRLSEHRGETRPLEPVANLDAIPPAEARHRLGHLSASACAFVRITPSLLRTSFASVPDLPVTVGVPRTHTTPAPLHQPGARVSGRPPCGCCRRACRCGRSGLR